MERKEKICQTSFVDHRQNEKRTGCLLRIARVSQQLCETEGSTRVRVKAEAGSEQYLD
jgi:hypothetical protein